MNECLEGTQLLTYSGWDGMKQYFYPYTLLLCLLITCPPRDRQTIPLGFG